MQTNITSYGTYELINEKYVSKDPWLSNNFSTKTSWVREDFKVPCILIFGPNQDKYLEFAKNNLPKDKKIIFEGKKAVNNRSGHNWPRFRNTLLVIDKVED